MRAVKKRNEWHLMWFSFHYYIITLLRLPIVSQIVFILLHNFSSMFGRLNLIMMTQRSTDAKKINHHRFSSDWSCCICVGPTDIPSGCEHKFVFIANTELTANIYTILWTGEQRQWNCRQSNGTKPATGRYIYERFSQFMYSMRNFTSTFR